MAKNEEKYQELNTVIAYHSELSLEEFPEGPYGAAHNEKKLGKNSPRIPGQHSLSAFTYENKEFHEGLEREIPGSHPTHDDPQN